MAFALGRAAAHHLAEPGGAIVVGQDTRRSGDMFVSAIAAGASSVGVDVQVVGVVPTPALAFLARTGPFAGGIMVSASHNPADDNGLKVLDRDGLKLDDAVEDELEQLIWRAEELPGVTNATLGWITDRSDLVEAYVTHRLGLAASIDAAGLRIVLDGANGSGCMLGPRILAATGATVEVIHAEPDGVNINVRSGATDPASLAEAVVARGADVGFALDGDADRLIAVDAAGRIVDGDQVLGILALDRLGRGALPGGGLVVSVLSNGGLQDAVEAAGGQILRTPGGRQVHPRGHAALRRGPRRREERPRHRARAHDLGRRHRDRARGAPGHGGGAPHARRPGRADPAAPAAAAGREGPPARPLGVRSDLHDRRLARHRAGSDHKAASSCVPRERSPRSGSWSRGPTRMW